MRTTVTIDDDVARMLHDAMHRQRKNFKEILNLAIRRGLTVLPQSGEKKKHFEVKGPFLGGLQPGIDPTGFNKLAADLEDEEMIQKMRRSGGIGSEKFRKGKDRHG